MAEASFYPEVFDAPSQPDLARRVAELERVVATLASLRLERAAADGPERRDPVALTSALHPSGMRSARKPWRRTPDDGTLPLRFVMFDGSASR
ncbi:MAG: hypothetical protein QOD72_3677 [Acidimicrobiaceae bacterium]|jgi:hypothetical protein|nr:hypothetical protein [Acidimicrobiaceae bacterium]